MNSNKIIKRVAILSAILLVILVISRIVDYDRIFITNVYRGLFGKRYYALPTEIVCFRNSCKIDDPLFRQNDKGNWSINVRGCWIPIDNHISSFVTEVETDGDSYTNYGIAPKFKINEFGHNFEFVEPDILYGNPNAVDNITFHSGIYIHKRLVPLISFHDEMSTSTVNYPYFVRAYLWAYSIRCRLENMFSKSYSELLETYATNTRIYYKSPLLYVPFPLSGNGYIFSSEVLDDFKDITHYMGDQNFYATYVSIPSDIKRVGTVVKYDEDGVLIKLPVKRTKGLRLYLQKSSDNNDTYFAIVYYNKTDSHDLITEQDYKNIVDYSDSHSTIFNAYDEIIFANLRKLLSGI